MTNLPSREPSHQAAARSTPGQRPLVLASSSVYRRELLQRLGLPFRVIAPDVNEAAMEGEAPSTLAMRLAHAKALAVARLHPEAVVIGSDQVADLHGQALGKPGGHGNAGRQLQAMSGNVVHFHTAVTVACLDLDLIQTELASVMVRFRTLSAEEIETYLQREQPYDCAGSAKSEGLGIALLDTIESDDPTALVGLPLIRTCRMLRATGISLP